MSQNNTQKIVLAVVALFAIAVLFDSFGSDLTGYAGWQGWTGCSSSNQCDIGEGDCDNDNECLPGLKCVDNVGGKYGFSSSSDVCEVSAAAGKPAIVNGGISTSYSTLRSGGNSEAKEVVLGNLVSGSVSNSEGVLEVSTLGNNVIVHTSLTSFEDDYETDVVLEAGRDSISYKLKGDIYSLVGQTFNFLGHSIQIIDLGNTVTDITGIMRVRIDGGPEQTIRDGDAFIGESLDNPEWVWNTMETFNNGRSKRNVFGIENDFIYNDDSDNPPKVGECIDLPNNAGGICLERLTVNNNDYYDLAIEYENSADLSDYDPTATSVKTIFISSNRDSMRLTNGQFTDKVWISSTGVVLYKDNVNRIQTLKSLLFDDQKIADLNSGELELIATLQPNSIDVAVKSSNDVIISKFGLVNGEINSLGNTRSLEEARELIWDSLLGPVLNIGTKDEDHRTIYGIIVDDPKAQGSNDDVQLVIPNQQVKAVVSLNLNQVTTVSTNLCGNNVCNTNECTTCPGDCGPAECQPLPSGALTTQQKQEVLNMLKVGTGGQCSFIVTPYGDDWNPSDSDYQKDVLPYINADSNGDTITTGAEYCNSLGKVCLYGFRKTFLSDRSISFGKAVTTDQIGCFGGPSYDQLKEKYPEHNEYYCCSV